ncbi:MAG: alkaline phosphatase D family protein [Phycisphaerales bacterium]
MRSELLAALCLVLIAVASGCVESPAQPARRSDVGDPSRLIGPGAGSGDVALRGGARADPDSLPTAALGSKPFDGIPLFGQMSLTDETDIKIQLPDGIGFQAGRYGFAHIGYFVGADPADPAKLVVQRTEGGTLGGYVFEPGREPPTLLLEWEQYHSQTGGSGNLFFTVIDTQGQQLRFQRLANQTRFNSLPGPGHVVWSENMPLDQWVRLRLEYVARSGGPGSNDGALVMRMDAGSGLQTVASISDHDMTNIDSIRLRLTVANTTSRLAAWRKLIWDGTGRDVFGATSNPDSLWRDTGHQIGAMEPDEAGGVRAKIWVHFNPGLYGDGGEVLGADVQLDTDPSFRSPLTQTIAISSADAYNGVATFSGLTPNTRYHVQARLKRNDVEVTTTYATSFRTMSVPGGAPGKIHIIHGSCSSSGTVWTPCTTFRTALAHAPDDATVVFSHIGDLNYIDVLIEYDDAPPGPDNPNATDALFDRMYDQMFLSAEFNDLASNASCWFMWDDHEVLNGWGGPGSIHQPDPALFEMARDAADRWWGNRLLDETSLSRRYYHVETSQCLFVYLDARSHGDQKTTLLGQKQKMWVKQLLADKPKPIVFLMSQVTWASGSGPGRRYENWHNHTAERDEIINHFLDVNPTGHVFLVSGDHHLGMHNTFDFAEFGPRVHGDWMSGTFATSRLNTQLTEWGPGGEYPADHLEYFGVPLAGLIRGYLPIDIDEKNLTVRLAFADGVTGEQTYFKEYNLAELPCPWDLDNNGNVGASDLLSLLVQWGTDPGGPPDFDGNGNVGASDLLALLANWGPCP